jgi:hypothetical protein
LAYGGGGGGVIAGGGGASLIAALDRHEAAVWAPGRAGATPGGLGALGHWGPGAQGPGGPRPHCTPSCRTAAQRRRFVAADHLWNHFNSNSHSNSKSNPHTLTLILTFRCWPLNWNVNNCETLAAGDDGGSDGGGERGGGVTAGLGGAVEPLSRLFPRLGSGASVPAPRAGGAASPPTSALSSPTRGPGRLADLAELEHQDYELSVSDHGGGGGGGGMSTHMFGDPPLALSGLLSVEAAEAAPPPQLVPMPALCQWVMRNPNIQQQWSAPDGGKCLSCGAVIPQPHGLLCTFPGSAGEPDSGLRALFAPSSGGQPWVLPATTCRGYGLGFSGMVGCGAGTLGGGTGSLGGVSLRGGGGGVSGNMNGDHGASQSQAQSAQRESAAAAAAAVAAPPKQPAVHSVAAVPGWVTAPSHPRSEGSSNTFPALGGAQHSAAAAPSVNAGWAQGLSLSSTRQQVWASQSCVMPAPCHGILDVYNPHSFPLHGIL